MRMMTRSNEMGTTAWSPIVGILMLAIIAIGVSTIAYKLVYPPTIETATTPPPVPIAPKRVDRPRSVEKTAPKDDGKTAEALKNGLKDVASATRALTASAKALKDVALKAATPASPAPTIKEEPKPEPRPVTPIPAAPATCKVDVPAPASASASPVIIGSGNHVSANALAVVSQGGPASGRIETSPETMLARKEPGGVSEEDRRHGVIYFRVEPAPAPKTEPPVAKRPRKK